MLVYGKVETTRDAAAFQAEITTALQALADAPPGLERHARLAGAFVDAAALICALIDRDASTEPAGMAALTTLARALDASWRGAPFNLRTAIARLTALPVTGTIQTKPTEGYAFYGLYPESYAEAARRSGLPPTTRVIGIRSIGAGLAAMVAAALNSPDPLTVRPGGHPFDRRIEPSPELASAMLAGDPPAFAVVDEGPGLSGSSFLSVVEWLMDHGVPRGRIHLFPSHPNGPGTEAGDQRRNLWHTLQWHVADFDPTITTHLPAWIAARIGPLAAPLRDISGGQWQSLTHSTAPTAPGVERRKYLAETASGRWLVKFAGLGSVGEHKLALARKLYAAGFAPEPTGLAYGFLLQRWLDAPDLTRAPMQMGALMPRLVAYLAFRATLAAPHDAGATLDTLANMAIYNTAQALGELASSAMRTRLELNRPSGSPHRVWIDARLHPWEWLNINGHPIKTDALDHATAHDFIGAQPIEWDLAGAIVEHDLDAELLPAAFETATGTQVDRRLLEYVTGCYLSFQLGHWTMLGNEPYAPARYRDKLAVWLEL